MERGFRVRSFISELNKSFHDRTSLSYLRMNGCIKAEYLQRPDYNVEQELNFIVKKYQFTENRKM